MAVQVQLAAPKAAALGVQHATVANAADPAATVGVPTKSCSPRSSILTTGRGIHDDRSTHGIQRHGWDEPRLCGYRRVSLRQPGVSGVVTVTLSFKNYAAAASLTATRNVTVVASGSGCARPTPSYPGSSSKDMVKLFPMGCSGVYQRAALVATAVLSNGQVQRVIRRNRVLFLAHDHRGNSVRRRDVSSKGTGGATVLTAVAWCGVGTHIDQRRRADGGIQSRITHTTSWSGRGAFTGQAVRLKR